MSEKEKISLEEAHKRFWFVDTKGLVTKGSKDLAFYKKPYMSLNSYAELARFDKTRYARDDCKKKLKDLKAVVEEVKPTCLIGLCGEGGAFDEELIKKMLEYPTCTI